jgi:DNA-binding response OmpR family regulator
MEKILIIDDEEQMLDTLKSYLEQRDYDVVTATDGEDGMAKLISHNPDLVICDINMPKKNGYQFLQETRKSRPWMPVIILSALSDPASVLKAHDLEADHYLTKPFKLEELLKSVKLMLSLAPLRRK